MFIIFIQLNISAMRPKFQEYNQQQNWLFPPSIEELIPKNHPVRIVNGVIEKLDLKLLTEVYSKEGRPSYHHNMMNKVMVIDFMDNFSSTINIDKTLLSKLIIN